MADNPLGQDGQPGQEGQQPQQGPTMNQAFNRGRPIPNELTRTIPAVQKVLSTKEQFDTWKFSVRDLLRALRLEQLIDKSIARPAEDAANYITWEEMSFQVACWLTGQISEEHQNRLQSYSKNIDLADDRFEAIKDIVMGLGTLRLKAAALKPIKMTRQQYSSAGDYMRHFMTATNTAIGLRCDIGAYVTALLFINELKDDLPNWCYNRQEQLTDDTSKFDWNDFRELYNSAIATYKAAHLEINAAAHRAPQSNNNNHSQSQPNSYSYNPINDPAHHG
ncbi:hypothetical protein BJY00DRAFT_141959 [Aspergillus carlsbadensis]|nr:hypothetical protein BJY00DRAFT_141959 [Aspergillus carlsbadensis]